MAGDVDDGWLAGFAGGEVAGLLGSAGAVAVGAAADGGVRQEDLVQNVARACSGCSGEKAATESVAAARARGKLMRAGGMSAAAAPVIWSSSLGLAVSSRGSEGQGGRTQTRRRPVIVGTLRECRRESGVVHSFL